MIFSDVSKFELVMLSPSRLLLLCACAVTLVRSSESTMSACRAFCQRNHDTYVAMNMCMETLCPSMYRQRVGRFGKRAGGAAGPVEGDSQSVCRYHCQRKHAFRWEPGQDQETLLAARRLAYAQCVEFRCRNMYRQRVGRFGKRAVEELLDDDDMAVAALGNNLEPEPETSEEIVASEKAQVASTSASMDNLRTLYSDAPVVRASPALIKLVRDLQ